MLEAAAADATPWVERRDELARKSANSHAVDARAALTGGKDAVGQADKLHVAAEGIMAAVRNVSSAPARVAILVRRFVDQRVMVRAHLVKLLEEQGQQDAAFLELLVGGSTARHLVGAQIPTDFDKAKELADRMGDGQGADVATALKARAVAKTQPSSKPAEIEAARDVLAKTLKSFDDLVAEIAKVSKSGNVLYEINPLVELMLLDGLREHVIGSSQQRTVHPDAMKWLARAVDATERVLVSLGISFPGMPAADEKKGVIEDFLRLQGYDHPRAQLESWQWVCEQSGASLAVREGEDGS